MNPFLRFHVHAITDINTDIAAKVPSIGDQFIMISQVCLHTKLVLSVIFNLSFTVQN